ncbi:unnamed protein product, partial [Meganyctiphanes norvegica]
MSRSTSVSVPRRELYVVPERRGSLELEDIVVPPVRDQPREYDSWPCDSFFLLPDSVLSCDATAFRQDLMSLDPVLSASLPDWDIPSMTSRDSPINSGRHTRIQSPGGHDQSSYRTRSFSTSRVPVSQRSEHRSITLLDHHEGLTVHSAGKGTVMIG